MKDEWSEDWINYTKNDLTSLHSKRRRRAMVKSYSRLFSDQKIPTNVGNVLDAGCGFGELYEAAPKFIQKKYLGFDVSPYCINECVDKFHDSKKFVLRDITDKLNEVYDRIFCLTVLEHVADKRAALKNLRENLSENGVLYIEVRNSQYILKRFPKRILSIFERLGIIEVPIDNENFNDLCISDWCELYSEAGFKVVEMKRSYWPFYVSGYIRTIKNIFIAIVKLSLPLEMNYMIGFVLVRDKHIVN